MAVPRIFVPSFPPALPFYYGKEQVDRKYTHMEGFCSSFRQAPVPGEDRNKGKSTQGRILAPSPYPIL